MSASAPPFAPPPRARRVFVNRTLNVRSLAAVGFDLDYTLVHYHAHEWERRAYTHARAGLAARGFPMDSVEFDPSAFALGLVVDKELGNVVKANRFGFVKRAAHGMRMLEFEEQRAAYSRVQVDLAEPRWEFMNTLFSLSETCLFAQLVGLLDAGLLPAGLSYPDLYRAVRSSLDAAHVEGTLKREILAEPERFIVPDEELPLALLDLKHAGKKLLVVTNSEWEYARAILSYAFDRFLPEGGFRALFDVVIVGARKPEFFTGTSPVFEVVDDTGLLRPWTGPLRQGGAYLGANARRVEEFLGRPGEDILYVGDHVFTDVQVTKSLLRWRTALIVRELEEEIVATEGFLEEQIALDALMREKEHREAEAAGIRLSLQRLEAGYGPKPLQASQALHRRQQELRTEGRALDDRLGPLSRAASGLGHPRWGLLLRAGNDKSHLARQIERHADIYTSRVSNLLFTTPFAYLRSGRGNLPHDEG